MDPLGFWPILLVLATVLFALFLLTKITAAKTEPVKFMSLDGLRGYLALSVVLHHAGIYYFCVRTYIWQPPPSRLYRHFGETSVCLFFMMTAFLFFNRLIEDEKKPIDWLRLLISRIMRLYPAYLLAIAISLLYVAIQTNFQLREPLTRIMGEVGDWLLFNVFNYPPDINACSDTPAMMLGVLRTIRYEWLFYLLLPLIGFVFFRSRVSPLVLLISLGLFASILYRTGLETENATMFLGGIAAAYFARSNAFCSWASSKWASVVLVTCLVLTVSCFESVKAPLPMMLLSSVFIIIACGNSLFGLLTLRLSRELGKLSYGIYLLHGLVLFALFHYFSDFAHMAALSPLGYWLVLSATAFVLTCICFFIFHYYELPALRSSDRVTSFFRRKFEVFGLMAKPIWPGQLALRFRPLEKFKKANNADPRGKRDNDLI